MPEEKKSLTEVFTDVADAIRGKTGSEELIRPLDFADEITNIPSGGALEEAWEAYKADHPTDWSNGLSNISGVQYSVPTIRTYLTDISTLNFAGSENVTNMRGLFETDRALVTVPLFDTSSCENMSYMFRTCPKLTTIPLFNTSSAKTLEAMFLECSSLTSVPLLDTSSCTNMIQMFRGCTKLESIPALDTSKSTDLGSYAYECYQLASVPELDLASCTSLNYAFYNCFRLTTLSFINTSNLKTIASAFVNCTSLTTINIQDASGITNASNAFSNISTLSTLNLPNIGVSFDIHWASRLDRLKLLNIINNLADLTGGTAQTLTIGSTNLNKLTADDIAIATAKNWTLA